jgi:inhibitor of KinA
MTRESLEILPAGDRALTIRLGDRIDAATLARVHAALERLAGVRGITDLVAGFASLTVHYAPVAIAPTRDESPHAALERELTGMLRDLDDASPLEARLVEVPVCYEGDHAPDLDVVAKASGLSPDAVVAAHTAPLYTVHMIGFVPGFPYLGGLDARLATPRRGEPRTRVPAGSVGIGGAQTGVYPIASPGGWHLIGRTPLVLFDPRRDPPALLRVGDRVRFRAVSRREHDSFRES